MPGARAAYCPTRSGSFLVNASRARVAGVVTWACWFILLVQQVHDSWLHAAPWFIWVLKLVPLLMFLPGMLRDNLRSFVWLCFVSLGYFIILVQRMFAQPTDLWVALGLAAVVLLFIAGTLYIRWRARELRESSGA